MKLKELLEELEKLGKENDASVGQKDRKYLNIKRANLDHKITVVQMGAVEYLEQASHLFDLVFLDADRASYVQVADQILSLIRPGGILVCDNAVSHAEELREFVDFVNSTGGFTTTTVPVGKGEFVACKKT